MSRRLLASDDLERILSGARRVLGEMGMRVRSRRCLDAMEAFGAKLDLPQERAFMPPDVIDRLLAIVRAEQAGWQRAAPYVRPEYSIGPGGTCPFVFDDDRGQRRLSGEADCVEMFRILETSPATGCETPVYNCDAPPRLQSIDCLRIGLETLDRTTLTGIDLFYPEQVPFVAELGRLYRDDPTWFLPAGNCPNSPLCVSERIADLALAKAPYRKIYAVPTMPVMGANAPVTPAGAAVIGVAEILGGYVLAKSLEVETPVAACALSAMLDLKTGTMTCVAPEVFAADVAISEVFEILLDLPCRLCGLYIDAPVPGLQAVREKLLRCLGLGLFGNLTGLPGTLAQGKVFSPTQMMLDYDLHQFLAAYTAGPVVNGETLGVEAILEIGWEETGYLMHEHTRAWMRETWQAPLPLSSGGEPGSGDQVVARAREMWCENLKHYEPPHHPDDFRRELRAICRRAKEALAE